MVLAAVLALVLVVAGAVTALVLALPDDGADGTHATPTTTSATPTSATPTPSASAAAVTEADRASATSFVASSLPTILGYTPTGYDAHVRASLALMTPAYAATYRTTASRIRSTVIQQGATVTARTTDTGLSGISSDTAGVLAFVRQTTQRDGTAGSTVTPSAVSVTLQRSGTAWLIDGLVTTAAPAGPTEPDPDHRSAMSTARQVVTALLDIDYRHPARSRDRVLALSTGAFAQQYRSSAPRLTSLLVRMHTVQTGTVLATGVSRLSGSTADVLVSATSDLTSTNGPRTMTHRILVTLDLVGGAWRAAELSYVS